MKLISQSPEGCCFQLNENEASLLRGLLKRFPFGAAGSAVISKSDESPASAERRKLLKESLADHRRQLKKLALDLLTEDKWRPSAGGPLLMITMEAREILLQILNDIRLGCWRALGEPEDIDEAAHSEPQFGYRSLMDLAGYFEMNLLDPDIQ